MSWETNTHFLFGEIVEGPSRLPLEQAKRHFAAEALAERSARIQAVPLERILTILERAGDLMTDPKGRYRLEAMERLPEILSYSPQMVERGLQFFAEMTRADALRSRLLPLGDPRCVDHFVHVRDLRVRRAVPVGGVCHIAAGNVFLGSVDSLLHGLVTKNVNVLKASRQDRLFPSLFFRALREADEREELFPTCAGTYWSREDVEIDALVKERFEAVLLFGGEDSVRSYKQGLSAKTELLGFGPKLSFGLVLEGLDEAGLQAAARGFADDVTWWEQRACTSCQNLFVEDSGDGRAERFSRLLFDALGEKARELPPGALDADTAVEIRKEREQARWDAFQGAATLLEGRTHTVILRDGHDLVDSPLHRTIFVNRVCSYRELLAGNLATMRYFLGTVGVAGESGLQEVAEALATRGVLRFCRPGSMATGADLEAAHDGVHLCLQLMRFVEKEDLSGARFGSGFLDRERRDRLLLARLEGALRNALKAPFYRRHLGQMEPRLRGRDDWRRLPVLEASHVVEHGPAACSDMLTRPPGSHYLFSAGGTTGRMKYVAYSREEFDESKKIFGLGFRLTEMEPTDVVANFMRAGAFWTAFVATNAGLEEVGCRILSMTANQDDAVTLDYLRTFRPTAIVSITSNLVLLAQEAERQGFQPKIDKVYYGGEHMPAPVEDYVRRVFGASTVRSMGYAAVEVGPIGFQCAHCRGTEHHVFDDWCHVERDEEGDILITTLGKTLQPLLRYRLGDRIDWVEEPCACGRSAPRFRLLARSDDEIRLNSSNLYMSEIFEAFAGIPELSSFFQVVLENEGTLRKLTFRVELKQPGRVGEVAPLRARILGALRERSRALGAEFDLNLLAPLVIEVLPAGGLERVGRTGKVRRFIDKRVAR